MRPAPDPEKSIPWLYAEDASGIRLRNVRFGRKREEERAFSVEALVRSVEGLEESDVREDVGYR